MASFDCSAETVKIKGFGFDESETGGKRGNITCAKNRLELGEGDFGLAAEDCDIHIYNIPHFLK